MGVFEKGVGRVLEKCVEAFLVDPYEIPLAVGAVDGHGALAESVDAASVRSE